MTVSELIERLRDLPQDAVVVSYEPPSYDIVQCVKVIQLGPGFQTPDEVDVFDTTKTDDELNRLIEEREASLKTYVSIEGF